MLTLALMTPLQKPKALAPGATIAAIAPSSWFNRDLFMVGVNHLQQAGYNVIYRNDLFEQHRYLAGNDARRAAELMQHLCDPKIDMIMCARGGYGMQRVVPLLDAAQIPATPKLVVGYSDITVLHSFLQTHKQWVTFYGPTIAKHLGSDSPFENWQRLLQAVTHTQPLGTMPMGQSVVIRPGTATGRLVGGCLTLIQMGVGTSYDIDTRDSILFLEDTGEKLYEIDRMITHLKHAGKLKDVRGLILGSMPLHAHDADKQHDYIPTLQELLADFTGPVIAHYPAGHCDPFVTLPLGVEAKLSTLPLCLELTEAACS